MVADALSRRPDHRLNAISEVKVQEDLMLQVGRAAETDPEYQRIKGAVGAGKRPDFQIKDNLGQSRTTLRKSGGR